MLFISDAQYYVPVKLCRETGNIYLFKIVGHLTPEKVKLRNYFYWDILEIERIEVNVVEVEIQ